MRSNVIRKELAVIRQLGTKPFVTLLMPFDPKMTSKYSMENQVARMQNMIKNELFENYSVAYAKDVSDKLFSITSNLNYHTHKKSIAILVSSEKQKVFYLDFPVEEKFVIDDTFHIRQLLPHKKEEKEYLLLVVNSRHAAIYRGKDQIISQILFNIPEYERQIKQEAPESFSSSGNAFINKDELVHKFLKATIHNLSLILSAFRFPVLVLASGEVIDSIKILTQNMAPITAIIQVEPDSISENEIEKIIEPYINNWQNVKDTYLMQQLEHALESGMLAVGIQDVWNMAEKKNCKQLVVENGYEYRAYIGKEPVICAEEVANNEFHKDVVADAIEKVLSEGGEVAFVSDGFLKDYMHIAAIRSY